MLRSESGKGWPKKKHIKHSETVAAAFIWWCRGVYIFSLIQQQRLCPSSIGAHRIQDNVTRESSRQHFQHKAGVPEWHLLPHLRIMHADKIIDAVTIPARFVPKTEDYVRLVVSSISRCLRIRPQMDYMSARHATVLFPVNASCVLIFAPQSHLPECISFVVRGKSCNLLFFSYC
jgi:hypothetical protein